MSDVALIERWLRRNQVRRFERGASASPDHLRPYLRERGYELKYDGWKGGGTGTVQRIGGRGRPRKVNMRSLIAFVDELRIAEGLEPIMPGARE